MNDFDWTDLEEYEVEELQSYVYDELGADNAIERVKEIDGEIDRLLKLSKQKIEQIEYNTDLKIKRLEKKKEWDLFNLGALVDSDPNAKETKTQRKKVYISGEVIRKKPTEKLVKPEWSEDDIRQFVDEEYHKTKLELNWAEYKKTLLIKNGKVYNSDGELVSNIDVEYVPSKTIVK